MNCIEFLEICIWLIRGYTGTVPPPISVRVLIGIEGIGGVEVEPSVIKASTFDIPGAVIIVERRRTTSGIVPPDLYLHPGRVIIIALIPAAGIFVPIR